VVKEKYSHYLYHALQKRKKAEHQRLMPEILATQEAEIRRIPVRSQPRKIVHKTLPQKNPSPKKDWWSGSRCRL
jgi:hypothetical protein